MTNPLLAVLLVVMSAAVLAYGLARHRRGRYWHRLGEPWTPSPAEAADFAALQGYWEHISTTRDGIAVDGPPCTYMFRDDTFTVSPEGKQSSVYTFRLSAQRLPKELDIVASWASGKVMTTAAIYELDGDTLRWAHLAGQRPSRFPEPAAPGTIVTLRRISQH